jgi:hypothetical protein
LSFLNSSDANYNAYAFNLTACITNTFSSFNFNEQNIKPDAFS